MIMGIGPVPAVRKVARTRRPRRRRDRSVRAERSVRGAVAGRRARTRARPGEGERSTAGPSRSAIRSARAARVADDARVRAAGKEAALRCRVAVYRRRNGHRHGRRSAVVRCRWCSVAARRRHHRARARNGAARVLRPAASAPATRCRRPFERANVAASPTGSASIPAITSRQTGGKSHGLEVLGFYHSHPHSPAHPSPTRPARRRVSRARCYLIVGFVAAKPPRSGFSTGSGRICAKCRGVSKTPNYEIADSRPDSED